MNKGDTWLKLYRSMLEWEWYKKGPTKEIFLHLLLIANIEPQKKEGGMIPAGSIDRTYAQLVDETGLTLNQIRRAFSNLKRTGEITVRRQGNYSVISIVKWKEFQGGAQTKAQTSHRPRTDYAQTSHTLNKNSNNYIIQEEEEILPPGAVRLPDGSVDYENVPSNWDW